MTLIYYNGVDNYLFRQIMRQAGVTNACLSFIYSKRTPKANWHYELDFIDNLIIYPGVRYMDDQLVYEYAEFINCHETIINYAVVPSENYEELYAQVSYVELLPLYYTTYDLSGEHIAIFGKTLKETFSLPHITDTSSKAYVHGFNVGFPGLWERFPLDSVNTGSWLSGKYGTLFYFDGKHFHTYSRYDYNKYLVFCARKLLDLDYEISLSAIKKRDSLEIALMNLIYWTMYERRNND